MNSVNPEQYEAWYHTRRGRWIDQREFSLLMALMLPARGNTLLDVGSGTGYFSRRFAEAGFQVIGVDPDPVMLHYAQTQGGGVGYLEGVAQQLPFADGAFDYCAAVTSLCFVDEPMRALAEMWRVCRRGVVLGLLNRSSLLYRQKHDRGGYRGARWDRWPEVMEWSSQLAPSPVMVRHKTAVFFPGNDALARVAEHMLPNSLPWGGFMAVYLAKPG